MKCTFKSCCDTEPIEQRKNILYGPKATKLYIYKSGECVVDYRGHLGDLDNACEYGKIDGILLPNSVLRWLRKEKYNV